MLPSKTKGVNDTQQTTNRKVVLKLALTVKLGEIHANN